MTEHPDETQTCYRCGIKGYSGYYYFIPSLRAWFCTLCARLMERGEA